MYDAAKPVLTTARPSPAWGRSRGSAHPVPAG